jgi:hypothetical protein
LKSGAPSLGSPARDAERNSRHLRIQILVSPLPTTPTATESVLHGIPPSPATGGAKQPQTTAPLKTVAAHKRAHARPRPHSHLKIPPSRALRQIYGFGEILCSDSELETTIVFPIYQIHK